MDDAAQAELERRILALVRDYVDQARELYPHGFEIGDFAIVYEFLEAPEPDEPLRAWEHPRDPGWRRLVAISKTPRSLWMTEVLLEEALRRVREDWSGVDDEDDDDAED